jgi:hypothetical protein
MKPKGTVLRRLLTSGLLAGGLFLFPSLTAAQGCFVCDDEWLSDVECAPADWTEHGWTQCEVVWTSCEMGGTWCWGPDPGEEQLAVLAVRADGTLIQSVAGDGPFTSSPPFASAESYGFSPRARIYERTCKGLITGRVFGEAMRNQINQRVHRIAI